MTTEWINVNERLPEPFKPSLNRQQEYLCHVRDTDGTERLMLCAYGRYEWLNEDLENRHPDEDEDGFVSRFGWFYERDSEGEYDSLIFDMNGKVKHWMPLPDSPETTLGETK